jgi:hypothetical protein
MTEFYFTPELHLRDGHVSSVISMTQPGLPGNRRFGLESIDVTKFYIESSAPKLRACSNRTGRTDDDEAGENQSHTHYWSVCAMT